MESFDGSRFLSNCRSSDFAILARPFAWLSLVRSGMGSGPSRDAVKSFQYFWVQPHLLGLLCRVRFVRQCVSATRSNTCIAAREPTSRDLATHARHGVGSRAFLCRRHSLELDVLLCYSYRLFDRNNRVLGCGSVAFNEGHKAPALDI